MKRDMDLIRALLLFAEENVPGGNYADVEVDDLKEGFPNLDREMLRGHVMLLRDAGFFGPGGDTISSISIDGLTWEGQDFLDSVRDDAVWANTKKAASEAGGFTVDLLKQIAVGFVKTQVKKHTDIEL